MVEAASKAVAVDASAVVDLLVTCPGVFLRPHTLINSSVTAPRDAMQRPAVFTAPTLRTFVARALARACTDQRLCALVDPSP